MGTRGACQTLCAALESLSGSTACVGSLKFVGPSPTRHLFGAACKLPPTTASRVAALYRTWTRKTSCVRRARYMKSVHKQQRFKFSPPFSVKNTMPPARACRPPGAATPRPAAQLRNPPSCPGEAQPGQRDAPCPASQKLLPLRPQLRRASRAGAAAEGLQAEARVQRAAKLPGRTSHLHGGRGGGLQQGASHRGSGSSIGRSTFLPSPSLHPPFVSPLSTCPPLPFLPSSPLLPSLPRSVPPFSPLLSCS